MKHINFDEDSEDEYDPKDDELLLVEDESYLKKRKRNDTKSTMSKKAKLILIAKCVVNLFQEKIV